MKREDTTKLIGDFLQAFNEIEAQTYWIIKRFPQDKLAKHAEKIDQFKNRVRFIQALIRSSNFNDKHELERILEKTIELNGFRNKLSHNPIRHVIFSKDGETRIKQAIFNSKSGDELNQILEVLPKKLEEVKSLLLDLMLLINGVKTF